MQYEVWKNIPDHSKIQDEITSEIWQEFMLHDPVCNSNWNYLFQLFPQFQLSIAINNEVLGIANCIPFYWNRPYDELPDKGWDWVFEKGVSDKQSNIKANTLCGLQIAVNKKHQGKGVSSLIFKEMISIACVNGFKSLTIPVRPSLKSKYPLTPIDNYIKWKKEDGLSYDPWLRVHTRLGGRIIKPCHEAMYIPGTIKEWEEWTNMRYFETGNYVVQGALVPVKMDIENNIGEYIEPNVWVLHQVDKCW